MLFRSNLIHVDSVEQLTGAQFAPVLAKRKFSAIIIGGGSPCQANSSLNLQRRSLGDARSWQPKELARLRSELLALPERGSLPVLCFLENVASMRGEVREAYSEMMGGQPIRIQAGIFGWTTRNRLYWGVGPAGSIADLQRPTLPQGLSRTGRPPVLAYPAPSLHRRPCTSQASTCRSRSPSRWYNSVAKAQCATVHR